MTASVYSCDACGCSISGYGMGMFSAFHNNFFGLNWQLSKFESTSGHGNSTDYFNTVEISGQYFLSDKFKILFNQPFRINRRVSGNSTNGLNGISDTRIVGSYSFFKNESISENLKIFFDLGAGIKIPVGNYNSHLHDLNLPENFNIGNGSWGLVFQPNAVLSYNETGVVISAVFQYYTKSSSKYKFGNQLSTQLLFYWSTDIFESLRITPFAGLNSEMVGEDIYANGNPVPNTGGLGTYLTTGTNLKTGDWLIGLSYLNPIAVNYSSGSVNAGSRVSFQLSYIF